MARKDPQQLLAVGQIAAQGRIWLVSWCAYMAGCDELPVRADP
jgi:hypothetical protein